MTRLPALLFLSVLAISFIFCCPQVSAEEHPDASTGLTMTLGEGWKATYDDAFGFFVSATYKPPPEGSSRIRGVEIVLIRSSVNGSGMAVAMERMPKVIASAIKSVSESDIRLSEVSGVEIPGLKNKTFRGTIDAPDGRLSLIAVLIENKDEIYPLYYVFGEPGAIAVMVKEIDRVFNSIRKKRK